jgi:hypothetical protein
MKKSKLGYKRNSPDVKKPYNVIPSGRITMKDVDFPVFGIDDMGNEQMMYPGGEYQFPGSQVFEIPMAQFGMSKRKVDRILNENKDLNWVKRLYESNAPSITLPGESKPSTHFMESADGRVYPTVVQMPDGSLQYLGDDAYDYAMQTGEYIQFKNDRQARRFGKDYKKGTGVLEGFQYGGQGKTPVFPQPVLNPALAKYLQKPENIEEAKERIISDAKGVTLESKVNRALGNPKRRAAGLSEAVADLSEGPIDNIRHTAAGMYTGNAIAEYLNPDDNVLLTVPAKAAGFIGSNLGGIAHEVKAFVPSLEGDYTNVLPAARMTLEDTFNNFVGSALSVNPFMSEKEKEDLIINLSNSNLLPDGYEKMSPSQAENMYVKEFGGDLEEFGSGGLKQWFAEKWVDVKTGKECGRSGKDKNGRPYPACRPSKRVNSTTPKTTSEMSSSEKAKFKSVKNSGKRISYNHKRSQQGGEQKSTAENILQFLDPTGVLSWDEAGKAYNEWEKSGSSLPSFTQALDMFGAVPALGKFGKLKYLADPKAMKTIYKYFPWQQTLNAADTVQDETASKPAIPRTATEASKKKQEGGQMPTMDNLEGMFDYWMNNYNTSGLLKDKSREEALDEFKKIYLKAATRN